LGPDPTSRQPKENVMTAEAAEGNRGHEHKIHVTIDGQPFALEDRHYTATELLALAGLPSGGYDLTRVGKHGRVESFHDDDKVAVHDGDTFVSVNQRGTVA